MAKNVLIMGATSGIGAELARCFAALGCNLALAGRRGELLEKLEADLRVEDGPVIVWEKADVRSETAPDVIRGLAEKLGGLDLYIHSSGIGEENPELDPAVEVATAETNATGFIRCIDAAASLLEAQPSGGQLAAITSVASVRGIGISPAYSATKALQAHYLEALRQRFRAKGLGISVTDIRPGFVATPLLGGKAYPMLMTADYAAEKIVQALLAKKRVAWIDWRYRLLALLWAMLPGALWEAFPVGFVPFETPKGRGAFGSISDALSAFRPKAKAQAQEAKPATGASESAPAPDTPSPDTPDKS